MSTEPIRILVPRGLDINKPVPIVFALHGAGGTENLFFDGYGNGVTAMGNPADATPGEIVRFDGRTGEFIDNFVDPASFIPPNDADFVTMYCMVFGPRGQPDGSLGLDVGGYRTNDILRFHGATGAYLGEFVAAGSGGLDHMLGMTFGPDGSLYVTSHGDRTGNATVLRYQGPDGDFARCFHRHVRGRRQRRIAHAGCHSLWPRREPRRGPRCGG